MPIQGHCENSFAQVREEFIRNFAERGEVGASVCVTFKGETVVDLWGGLADPISQRPWQKDTISVVWSSTKGAVALCAHMLAARGLLDFNAPVAQYWPEFAAQGKAEIPVKMLLNHQAGLAALHEPIPNSGYCDWDSLVRALASQKPLWEPGTRHGYHALTFGHLIGELIRRVSGKTIGRFFREEVAEPLGLDFWIGLPEEYEDRVAANIPAPPPTAGRPLSTFLHKALHDAGSIPYMVAMHSGGFLLPGFIDRREVHAAEIPAANGITNARGLAGMYRPLSLDGAYQGHRLLPREAMVAMGAVMSAGLDATMQVPTRFTLGFMKGMDNRDRRPGERDSALLSEDAFGHIGNGGSFGFADPRAEMSIGYTMNQQGSSIALNERGQTLIDAVYRSLGFRQFAGFWSA